jgi:hypothetical protein
VNFVQSTVESVSAASVQATSVFSASLVGSACESTSRS